MGQILRITPHRQDQPEVAARINGGGRFHPRGEPHELPRMSYIDYAREYRLPEDWAPSPGASIVVLVGGVPGRPSNPDTINRAIELASFLESQPGVPVVRPVSHERRKT